MPGRRHEVQETVADEDIELVREDGVDRAEEAEPEVHERLLVAERARGRAAVGPRHPVVRTERVEAQLLPPLLHERGHGRHGMALGGVVEGGALPGPVVEAVEVPEPELDVVPAARVARDPVSEREELVEDRVRLGGVLLPRLHEGEVRVLPLGAVGILEECHALLLPHRLAAERSVPLPREMRVARRQLLLLREEPDVLLAEEIRVGRDLPLEHRVVRADALPEGALEVAAAEAVLEAVPEGHEVALEGVEGLARERVRRVARHGDVPPRALGPDRTREVAPVEEPRLERRGVPGRPRDQPLRQRLEGLRIRGVERVGHEAPRRRRDIRVVGDLQGHSLPRSVMIRAARPDVR